MILTLWLLKKNIPLYKWREFEGEEEGAYVGGFGGIDEKTLNHAAAIMVRGLSHPEVVDLLARDFNSLPSLLRTQFTNECNRLCGSVSNNKTKGISRLNKKVGGKILSFSTVDADDAPTYRERRVVDGELAFRDRRIDPAVAGATRKYAAGHFYGSRQGEDGKNKNNKAESRRARKEQKRAKKAGF